MKFISQTNKDQKILVLTVCALIFYQPFTLFINTICNFFVPAGFIYDTLICYLGLIYLFIRSLRVLCRRPKLDAIMLVFLLLLIYLATFLFFSQNIPYMFTSVLDVMGNPIYVLFIFAFSGYMFVRNIYDYELLVTYLSKVSFGIVLLSTITFFLMQSQDSTPQYMVFSYNILLPATFLLIQALQKKSLPYMAVSLVGIGMILLAGARGALVSLGLAVITYLYFHKNKTGRKFFIMAVSMTMLFFLYTYYEHILVFFQSLANQLHISSRSIDLMLSGEFMNDSGRGVIQQKIISQFSLLGSGMYGDRVCGGGSYAHNLFIEVVSQYGIIFGPILLFALLVLLAIAILSKDTRIRTLSIIFLSTGFYKLLFSGSYLNQEPSFYILLGLAVNALILQHGSGLETKRMECVHSRCIR